MTPLGEKLRELRGTRTLYEVQQATKIDRGHLKRYEAGELSPTMDKLKLLGEFYGAMEELMFLYFEELLPGELEREYVIKWAKKLKSSS
jgi:transcriptional regulator with XRE-family HTH domain